MKKFICLVAFIVLLFSCNGDFIENGDPIDVDDAVVFQTGWKVTPIKITDNQENERGYYIYIPINYKESNDLVMYFVGSVCTNTNPCYGCLPDNVLFMSEYAELYNFILLIPFPIYRYTDAGRTCYGWVQLEEMDFINRLMQMVTNSIFKNNMYNKYAIGVSAGACMSHYVAYNTDRVIGVFSHGQGALSISHLLPDIEDVSWKIGYAYNRYDYPEIMEVVEQDYAFFTALGVDTEIWRDCDDNHHSWSVERTGDYFEYLFGGDK